MGVLEENTVAQAGAFREASTALDVLGFEVDSIKAGSTAGIVEVEASGKGGSDTDSMRY